MTYFRVVGKIAVKLTLAGVRLVAYMFWVSGLFGAAMLLLQGVAQLEGEGLRRLPETGAEVRGRLMLVSGFLAAGFCGWLVTQVARFVSEGLNGDLRPRLLLALFKGIVFWAATSLFFCLLPLAASFQARWKVAPEYYWVAGVAGVVLLLLGCAAEWVHRRLPSGRDTL